MITPLPKQLEAIQTEGRPVLVEAGAGTGKTWVLVRRFLHLLEQHPDWTIDNIVAVTFTEKAAREMRTRIRQAVEQLAAASALDSPWQARRRELDRMQVSTIHSLCVRILRENAVPAALDPSFDILDEQQAEILKEAAVRQMLADLAAQPAEARPPALNLLDHFQVRDLHELLSGLLGKRGIVETLFNGLLAPPALFARWQSIVAQTRQELWETLAAQNPSLEAAIRELLQISITDPEDRLAPVVQRAQQGCQAWLEGAQASALQAWLEIRLNGGKADCWGGKPALESLKANLVLLRDTAQAIDKAGCSADPGELDQRAAEALHWWADLWRRLIQVYDHLKTARNVLDFDDLELLAARLLDRRPRAARLQAFLSGIRHLMVDEYQDTNQVQARLLYALADPFTSDRLFVVGDPKQSIYRFRQAQVSVFNHTGQEFSLISGCDPVRLDCSFRTQASLVTALNDLFDVVLKPQGQSHAAYEAPPGPLSAQRPARPDQAAAVEILLLPAKTEHGLALSSAEARIFEARLLAERLKSLQAEEFPVWDRQKEAYRPFRYSDAAILFRALSDLPLYEEQFKAAGLPYLTVSGRGYYDRPEVHDLVALLTCLYNPADDLSLATVLRAPIFGLNDETLYRLRWFVPPDALDATVPVPYFQALQFPPATGQPEQVAFAAETLLELRTLVGRVDVWRLLRTALDRTGYEATLIWSDQALEGSGRQYSNVQKLLDLARTQSGLSLSEFLGQVEDLRLREAREGEALGRAPEDGAVQLMSIHAAKGLEFPVVAVADLGRQASRLSDPARLLFDPAFGVVSMLRGADGEWVKPASYAWAEEQHRRMEAAEMKRLLYVACTRAADLLVLSGRPGRGGNWMADVLDAWQVPLAGDNPEEVLARREYCLRVRRPPYLAAEARHTRPTVSPRPEFAGLAEVPPLASPLAFRAQQLPVAVTRLARQLTTDDDGYLSIRPAVRPQECGPAATRAPSFRVGRLVHRALADWQCLRLPPEELDARLRTFAHQEGIFHAEAVNHALGRARRMLGNLRRSPLYAQVEQSTYVWRELPFTQETALGSLHGVIDLLFRDRAGQWFLIDWKTEWVSADALEAHARSHALQLAVYAAAVRQSLRISAHVALCFLNVGARLYPLRAEDLADALQGATL